MSFLRHLLLLCLCSFGALAMGENYQAPTANAGEDIMTRMGAQVILESKSSDPDGDALEHRWSIVSKPSGSKAILVDPNSKSPSFFADIAGVYRIRLVVSDGIFISNLDDVTIGVMENSTPVVVVDPYRSARVGELISFDASASIDMEMDELSYRWTLLKSPKGSDAALRAQESARVELAPDTEGLYVLKLWVSDGLLTSESHVALRVYSDTCEVPGSLEGSNCEGTFEVSSSEDLGRYLVTYGVEGDSPPKHIKIAGDLNLSGNLSLATPCRITTQENIDLNITGKLCLNAPKIYISKGNRINTQGDIEIKGGGIDFAPRVAIRAGDITLSALGEGEQSAVRIQGGVLIDARNLSLNADEITSIGARSQIDLTEVLSLTTRGTGDAVLGAGVRVRAKSVRLKSGATLSLLSGTQIDAPFIEGVARTIEVLQGVRLTSQSVYLDASDCIGVDEIRIDSPVKSGRCLSDSSLLAALSPLLKQRYFVGEAIAFDITDSKGYESAAIDFGDGATHEFGEDEIKVAHSYDARGVYSVVLTVSANDKTFKASLDLIVVDNLPPEVLDIAFDVQYDSDGYPIKQVPISVRGKTSDLGGSIAQYEYDFGDGSGVRLSRNSKVRHAYSSWGTYEVSVRVRDNLGAWSQPVTRELVLNNGAPTVDFDLDESIYTYDVIGLSGLECSDPEGSSLTYEWRIDGEHFSNDIVEAHFFEEPGTHYITLIVKDDKGRRNYVTKTLKVENPTEIFKAKLRIQARRNAAGQILGDISVDSLSSTIDNGEITSVSWSLSNGETGADSYFSTRLDPGRYLLELKLESSNENIAKVAQILDVAAKYHPSELPSPVNTTITGYNAAAFNAPTLTLTVSFDGEGIDLSQDIHVLSQDSSDRVSSLVKTSSNEITVGINALDGLNYLRFSAFDKQGNYVHRDFQFFAGSRTITIDVLDSSDSNVTNGVFKAVDTKSNTPIAITTITNSQFVMNNVPATHFYLYFLREDGDFAAKRISSTVTDVDLTLRGFSTVSTTPNLDLTQGSTGWTFDSDYVTLTQVNGQNRFQVVLGAGESTEYSHAFIASDKYLYQGVQIKGNIVDAYTNVILRNYTQDTVSVRSLSPQDLGYTTQGEFNIEKGSIFLEGNIGDQMEVIVQFVAPPSSFELMLKAQDDPNSLIQEIRSTPPRPEATRLRMVTKLFDICQECDKEGPGRYRNFAEELRYFSFGEYRINKMGEGPSNPVSVFYLLLGENQDEYEIKSVALYARGARDTTTILATLSSEMANGFFYKGRNRSFKPVKFRNTASLVGSDFANQKDLVIEIIYKKGEGESTSKRSKFYIPKKEILKEYEKNPPYVSLWRCNEESKPR